MGIDADLVLDKPQHFDELLCILCSEVLDEPMMLSPCDHYFCGDCIKACLQMNKQCPTCRVQASEASLKPLFRGLKNVLNVLRVRCPNHNRGCSSEFAIDHLRQHINVECGVRPAGCPFPGCDLTLSSGKLTHNELAAHVEDCQWRPVTCPLGCDDKIPFCNCDEHMHTACLQRLQTCPLGCGTELTTKDLSTHVTDTCSLTQIPCPVGGCRFVCQRHDLVVHMMSEWRHHQGLMAAKVAGMESQIGALESELAKRNDLVQQLAAEVDRLRKASATSSAPPSSSSSSASSAPSAPPPRPLPSWIGPPPSPFPVLPSTFPYPNPISSGLFPTTTYGSNGPVADELRKLQRLSEMGFTDVTLARLVLRQCGGDVQLAARMMTNSGR